MKTALVFLAGTTFGFFFAFWLSLRAIERATEEAERAKSEVEQITDMSVAMADSARTVIIRQRQEMCAVLLETERQLLRKGLTQRERQIVNLLLDLGRQFAVCEDVPLVF